MKKKEHIPEKDKNTTNDIKKEKLSPTVINVCEENEVLNLADIGRIFQFDRKNKNMTQESVAGLVNVGKRFISELENGKPTMQIDKVFKVLMRKGFKITISKRKW